MSTQHSRLAAGSWERLSLAEQMANIGSEVGRALTWKNKGNAEYTRLAFERALELLDLSLAIRQKKGCLRELARGREGLVDYFMFNNEYGSTDQAWQDYFSAFNIAARIHH